MTVNSTTYTFRPEILSAFAPCPHVLVGTSNHSNSTEEEAQLTQTYLNPRFDSFEIQNLMRPCRSNRSDIEGQGSVQFQVAAEGFPSQITGFCNYHFSKECLFVEPNTCLSDGQRFTADADMRIAQRVFDYLTRTPANELLAIAEYIADDDFDECFC